METYTIKKAYHWTKDHEVEIKSDLLIYAEVGNKSNGLQCKNLENHKLIMAECRKIARAIKRIDELNK